MDLPSNVSSWRYCRCAAKGLKTLTLFEDEAKKKMIPCLRPEPRKVTSNSTKNKNKTMNGTTRSTILHFCDSQSFKVSSVGLIFCLAGHLRTAVLANAINIGAVSKDHIVSTIEVNKAWTKNDPLFKNKKLFSLLQLQKPT